MSTSNWIISITLLSCSCFAFYVGYGELGRTAVGLWGGGLGFGFFVGGISGIRVGRHLERKYK